MDEMVVFAERGNNFDREDSAWQEAKPRRYTREEIPQWFEFVYVWLREAS